MEGSDAVIDMTLQEWDTLSAGFAATHLPSRVRWSNQQTDLGQVTLTTHLTGYASIDDLLLPLGLDTRLDWHNIDYFKLWVDKYLVDDRIANLEAPAAFKSAPEPSSNQARSVTSVRVAKAIWRLEPGGTAVIEFKDHLTLFEMDVAASHSRAVIAYARTLQSP